MKTENILQLLIIWKRWTELPISQLAFSCFLLYNRGKIRINAVILLSANNWIYALHIADFVDIIWLLKAYNQPNQHRARWVRSSAVTREILKRRICAVYRHRPFPITAVSPTQNLYAGTGKRAKWHTRHIWQPIRTLWFLTTKSSTRFRVRETAFSDFSVCGLNVTLKNSVKSQKTDLPKVAIRVFTKWRWVRGKVVSHIKRRCL